MTFSVQFHAPFQDALEQIVVGDDSGYFGNDGSCLGYHCANVFELRHNPPQDTLVTWTKWLGGWNLPLAGELPIFLWHSEFLVAE